MNYNVTKKQCFKVAIPEVWRILKAVQCLHSWVHCYSIFPLATEKSHDTVYDKITLTKDTPVTCLCI